MGNLYHKLSNYYHQHLLLFCLTALFQTGQAQKPPARGLPFRATDSVTVSASTKYSKASLLHRLFMGANYRTVWAEPVTMPVFNLANSGLKVTELGGGQQTKSLRLEDKEGREWVLRTVDKEVSAAVPQGLKGTIAQKVVQDLISAAHPYAPLVVASLAKSAGIIAPQPSLYYVPDDPAFGPYQAIFAGQVVYLEEREPTPDGADTDGTDDVEKKLTKAQKYVILQKDVLRARLLDMLIADWDRHADQWRWAEQDSAGTTFYYAIPRDRDQAFFMAGGLVPKVGKWVAMHHINWFQKKSKRFEKLSFKSWDFDHKFLNELDASDWEQITLSFQASLTDEAIEQAVRQLPPDIYQISGAEIEGKLKGRRNTLLPEVMDYYRYISAEVVVNGTEEEELFEVSGSGDNITVQVYSRKGHEKGKILYKRTFSRKETHRLHLSGFGGDDSFVVNVAAKSKIKLFLYGGEGEDSYEVNGKIPVTISDAKEEQNKLGAVDGARVSLQ